MVPTTDAQHSCGSPAAGFRRPHKCCLRCSPLSGSTALMSVPDSPVHSRLLFLLLVRSRAELECASLGIDKDKPRLIGDLLDSISLLIEGDSRSSGGDVGCLQPCTETPC